MRSTTLSWKPSRDRRLPVSRFWGLVEITSLWRSRAGLTAAFLAGVWIALCGTAVAQVYDVSYYKDTLSDGTQVLSIWLPPELMAKLGSVGLKSASISSRAGQGTFVDKDGYIWEADPLLMAGSTCVPPIPGDLQYPRGKCFMRFVLLQPGVSAGVAGGDPCPVGRWLVNQEGAGKSHFILKREGSFEEEGLGGSFGPYSFNGRHLHIEWRGSAAPDALHGTVDIDLDPSCQHGENGKTVQENGPQGIYVTEMTKE